MVARAAITPSASLIPSAPTSSPVSPPAPAYYDIQPGTSTRAQVELLYGEPRRRVTTDALIYEYAPPREDADSERVIVTFDPDTQKVMRVDAYLKTLLPGSAFQDKFGARIASRQRADGGHEEFFYPQLQALIYGEGSADVPDTDAPVVAVSFISPRTLAAVFVRRFDEAMERKAYEEARTEADKTLAVDPAGGEGYNLQGRLFAALGESEEALVRFTAAARSSASVGQYDRYMAHLHMADVYANQLKDMDKAGGAYVAAISAAPLTERAEARLKYARFLKSQGKSEEAMAELRKAADVDLNGDADARRTLAETYWDQGDYAVALPQYEALSRLADNAPDKPGNGAVYYRYGVALKRAGKSAEAIGAYEKAYKADPKQAETLTELAVLYREDGRDPEKSVALYREALALDKDNIAANRGLTEALYDAGHVDEARQQAQATLTLRPDDAAAMFTLARCYAAQKDKKAALLWLQRAVDAGFADRDALMADPSLELLREDRGFKRLLQAG
ncbi:MAG: tetratricopeptide repeat protein [Rhodospirillaceae bacterium]|nr:tetratricopeptide repeat protein [Rhodospirillaceae bacterium]